MANIERSEDVHDAIAAGAEGVGLYRTEMEVLLAGRLLSEDSVYVSQQVPPPRSHAPTQRP